MKHTFENDPRITAYALGELLDEERAAMEARLAQDDEAREYVEELRRTAAEIEAELGSEPALALTAAQRAALEAAAHAPVPAPAPRVRILPAMLATAIAAGVIAVAYVALTDRAETRSIAFEYELAGGGAGHHAAPEMSATPDERPPTTNAPGRMVVRRIAIFDPEDTAGMERVETDLRRLATSLRPPDPPGDSLLDDLGYATEENLPLVGFSLLVSEQEQMLAGFGYSGVGGPAVGLPAPVLAGRVGGEITVRSGATLSFAQTNEDGVAGSEFGGQFVVPAEREIVGPRPVTRFPTSADDLNLVTPGTEQYVDAGELGFRRTAQSPLATFSVDVDTASYSNARRFLTKGQFPPPASIRVEELVNYFRYDYAGPDDGRPFGVDVEVTGCPWQPEHRLLRVGLRTAELPLEELPPANLVFLIDVSGSMQADNKLPLVKLGLGLLVDRLREEDSVAIVTYASESRLALESTNGLDQASIRAAVDSLNASGSTNGGAGIQLAYEQAVQGFAEGGANRVILCTDGDFNVGVTDRAQLESLIRGKAASGVYLTVLGFGMGNLKDANLETLADCGNGGYAYVDSFGECRKVFIEELGANLVAVAKDAKVQVEFNPARVAAWRQVGYENRIMAAADFRNDQKDAGEIGAGHCVTALFEVVPAGIAVASAAGVPLRYAELVEEPAPPEVRDDVADELCTVALRWKHPATDEVSEDSVHVRDAGTPFGDASAETRFAAAVAAFALKLRGSSTIAGLPMQAIVEQALAGLEFDPRGHRAEFLDLVRAAQSLGLR